MSPPSIVVNYVTKRLYIFWVLSVDNQSHYIWNISHLLVVSDTYTNLYSIQLKTCSIVIPSFWFSYYSSNYILFFQTDESSYRLYSCDNFFRKIQFLIEAASTIWESWTSSEFCHQYIFSLLILAFYLL